MAQFDENQSAVEYGESLLASQSKQKKKWSNRTQKIKDVNKVLGALQLGDIFLSRKANQKADLFRQQQNSEKAQAINDLNQATRWRTETIKPLVKLVPDLNIDDPDAFSADGSVYSALYNRELATRKSAVRGQFSDKGLSLEDREQISNTADLQLKKIQKNYNKYKGYLNLTPELLKSNYDNIIKSGVRDIKSAKNTSSIRKILSKFNIGTKLNKELVESSTKGVYIPKNEHKFLNDRKAAKANFDKIMEGTDEESKEKRKAINIYWESGRVGDPPLKKKIPALTPDNKTHLESFFKYDKEGNLDGSWVDEAGIPRVEEKITWEVLFNERMGISDRRNLYTNVKTELQRIQFAKGAEENYLITDDDIIAATRNVMALDVVENTEVWDVWWAPTEKTIMYAVNPITARETSTDEEEDTNTDTTTTDTDTDTKVKGSTPPFKLDFNKAVSGFRQAIKKDEWTDRNGNVVPKDVDSLFDQLQSDYGNDPSQREALRSIYNEYKEGDIKTPFTPTTPTTIDEDIKPTTVKGLKDITRGPRTTGATEILKGIWSEGGKSIIRQDQIRLQRYVETGKQQLHLKATLEKYDLPSDASPEVVADMLLTTSEITGKNITELAIQKVADVLPDSENAKQFLTEIAEVESTYGTHRKTFKKQDSSGIFQIDKIAFDEVQRRIQPDSDVGENIRNYNEKLKEELGIDLTTASFSDLNTPLYGAAFARAYLLSIPESIPTTLKARAAYWKKYYNTSAGAGTVDKYLKRVTATTSLLNKSLG